MSELRIPIERMSGQKDLDVPAYATPGAAGMDLRAATNHPVALMPGERRFIPCGFALALPQGWEAQVRSRSGLAREHGVVVLNAPGTIDSDFRGQVGALLINHGAETFRINRGDRIAQLVIAPVAHATWTDEPLPPTERGEHGWGSTGT